MVVESGQEADPVEVDPVEVDPVEADSVEARAVKTRMVFVLGAGVGYVLGARAGRQKYDELTGKVQTLWAHPTVQRRLGQVSEVCTTVVSEYAPRIAARAVHTAKDALGLQVPQRS